MGDEGGGGGRELAGCIGDGWEGVGKLELEREGEGGLGGVMSLGGKGERVTAA